MLVIGVVGGVASGKSLVTSCLERLGAAIIDADQLGHEVLRQNDVVDQIAHRWGESILVDGIVDRKRLGRIVFTPGPEGQKELAALEAITHPRIGELMQSRLETLEQESHPAVVLDAPVMFKAGWDNLCNQIVFVDVPLEMRILRSSNRGWADDELSRREAKQVSIEHKRNAATAIVDNSGTKEATYHQVMQLWQKWNLELPKNFELPETLE